MTRKKRILITSAACLLLAAFAVFVTIAYLTDSETAVNNFTFGEVQLDLVENKFASDSNTSISEDGTKAVYSVSSFVPYAAAEKDPVVYNTGEADEVVFLVVEMPSYLICEVDESGQKSTESLSDIFRMQYMDENSSYSDITLSSYEAASQDGDGYWYLLSVSPESGDAAIKSEYDNTDNKAETETTTDTNTDAVSETSYTTYVFGYSKPIAAGGHTAALFDRIQLKNMTDSSYQEILEVYPDVSVTVSAYGIQANGLQDIEYADSAGVTKNIDVSKDLDPYSLEAIWKTYLEIKGEETVSAAEKDGALDLEGSSVTTTTATTSTEDTATEITAEN